jgi:hypothetical protein
MRRPWQKEGRGDDAATISLRKEMDARCIDARLSRGWRGYESTLRRFQKSRISRSHDPHK